MKRMSFFCLILLISFSCYNSDLQDKDLITIKVDKVDPCADLLADGQTVVNLTVTIDEDAKSGEKIKVRTSLGTLAQEREPDSEDKNEVEWDHKSGNDRVTVKLKTGRSPGTASVTATFGGDSDNEQIFLCPSPPQALDLATSAAVIDADDYSHGRDRATLTVKLSPPSFSSGWEVSFNQICSRKDEGSLSCPDPPPLRLPDSIRIGKDEGDTITAIAEPIHETEVCENEEISEFYVTIVAHAERMEVLEGPSECDQTGLPTAQTKVLFQTIPVGDDDDT